MHEMVYLPLNDVTLQQMLLTTLMDICTPPHNIISKALPTYWQSLRNDLRLFQYCN